MDEPTAGPPAARRMPSRSRPLCRWPCRARWRSRLMRRSRLAQGRRGSPHACAAATRPPVARPLDLGARGARHGGRGGRSPGARTQPPSAGWPRLSAGWRPHRDDRDERLGHAQRTGRATRRRLRGLDGLIGALRDGMGAAWAQTVVLVTTELGAPWATNGTGGTDHGTGSAAMVVGGAVQGGRMAARLAGPCAGALYEGRDLMPTPGARHADRCALRGRIRAGTRPRGRCFGAGRGRAPRLFGLRLHTIGISPRGPPVFRHSVIASGADRSTPMHLKVGELAQRTGLTVHTLHHYDEIGLLKPSVRSEAGYRMYAAQDVARLHAIQALRHLGLALGEIATILDNHRPADASTQRRIREARRAARSAGAAARGHPGRRRIRTSATGWRACRSMATFGKYFSAGELNTIFTRYAEIEREWLAGPAARGAGPHGRRRRGDQFAAGPSRAAGRS